MENRVLAFEGIHNFRDYGGYATAGGGRLKPGLLWRSGQHLEATAADLARVAALGLATVIDLRGNGERALFPCARPGDFAALVLFADGETASHEMDPASHIDVARQAMTTEDARAAMIRLNQTMAFRPKLVEAMRLYFAALADRPGPSLLHCVAGKDRTGFAAALLHRLMGVHEDDAMADYLLTNSAGNVEARIASGAIAIRRNRPTIGEGALRMLMSVRPEFLEAAFAALLERYPSCEAYAAAMLDVGPEALERIRINLGE